MTCIKTKNQKLKKKLSLKDAKESRGRKKVHPRIKQKNPNEQKAMKITAVG